MSGHMFVLFTFFCQQRVAGKPILKKNSQEFYEKIQFTAKISLSVSSAMKANQIMQFTITLFVNKQDAGYSSLKKIG